MRPKQVWAIRIRLEMDGRTRDLAIFNLAIDSKLPGCDVVARRVEDVAPSGYAVNRATVRQKKTGRPVRFELTEQTRQAVDDYIKAAGKNRTSFCSAASVVTAAAKSMSELVSFELIAELLFARTYYAEDAYTTSRSRDLDGSVIATVAIKRQAAEKVKEIEQTDG